MEIKLSFVILLTILLILSLVSAFGYTTKDIPSPPINYSEKNVNNSYWLRSLSPQQVADLYTETDPIWTANSSLVAYYQFLNNNFNGSGNFTTIGRVGIGTTTPDTSLHIFKSDSGGTAHTFAELVVEDQLSAMIDVFSNASGKGYVIFGDEDDPLVGGMEYDHDLDKLYLWSNNVQGMVLDDAGNVGIGTLFPTHKLDVVGGLNVTENLTANLGIFRDGGIYLGDSGFHLNLRVQNANLDEDVVIDFNIGNQESTPHTITIAGDTTLNDWFDQPVKKTSTSTFDRLHISGAGSNRYIDVGVSIPSAIGEGGTWDTFIGFHSRPGMKLANTASGSSAQGAGILLYNYGTSGAADIPDKGDRIGFFLAGGVTTGTTIAHGAGIGFYADEDWSSGSAPMYMQYEVAPIGSTSRSVGLKINSSRSVFLPGIYNVHADDRVVSMEANGQLGYDSSSLRYKENVKNLTQSDIDKILQLRPVTYNRIGSNVTKYGFGAEEVNKLFPEFVSYKTEQIWECIDDGMGLGDEVCDVVGVELVLNKTTGEPISESVNYGKMVVLAIELAQKTEQENQMLEEELCDEHQIWSWCSKIFGSDKCIWVSPYSWCK